MADWETLRERLRAEIGLDVDERDELACTIAVEASGGPRAQRVMVRRYEAWQRELVEIRSAFGEAEAWPAEALLDDNLNLPLGAVARHGDFLVLVHKACLADVSDDGILWLVRRIGTLADVLEARSGTDRF